MPVAFAHAACDSARVCRASLTCFATSVIHNRLK